jgi:hypothetical protein
VEEALSDIVALRDMGDEGARSYYGVRNIGTDEVTKISSGINDHELSALEAKVIAEQAEWVGKTLLVGVVRGDSEETDGYGERTLDPPVAFTLNPMDPQSGELLGRDGGWIEAYWHLTPVGHEDPQIADMRRCGATDHPTASMGARTTHHRRPPIRRIGGRVMTLLLDEPRPDRVIGRKGSARGPGSVRG